MLGSVLVVVSVVVLGSGGTISTALSVDSSVTELDSVVVVGVVVVVVVVDVRDVVVVVVVVRTIVGTVSGVWFCELSAVRSTAHTRIASNSTAATPEAYTRVCSRLSGSTGSDSTDSGQWGNAQLLGPAVRDW